MTMCCPRDHRDDRAADDGTLDVVLHQR
jgi:hypothetical protein